MVGTSYSRGGEGMFADPAPNEGNPYVPLGVRRGLADLRVGGDLDGTTRDGFGEVREASLKAGIDNESACCSNITPSHQPKRLVRVKKIHSGTKTTTKVHTRYDLRGSLHTSSSGHNLPSYYSTSVAGNRFSPSWQHARD